MLSFGLVVSQFNEQFTQPLAERTKNEIDALEPGAAVGVFQTPGAFELPLMVQAVAELKRYHAIIALGVILEGETLHADLVARSVTQALLGISLQQKIPVIHCVLAVKNEEQARERCCGEESNRGVEAARAAVAIARTLRGIK